MSDERDRIAADETAVEREYSSALEAKARRSQASLNTTIENTFTTSLVSQAPREGEFVGRIALSGPNDVLDGAQEFYIGSARLREGPYQVYSWATPLAACTYYRQLADRASLESVRDAVIGVRSFHHRGGRISDFQDEAFGDVHPDTMFPKRTLEIPRAPGAPSITRVAPESNRPLEPSDPVIPVEPMQPPKPSRSVAMRGPALRAPDLLLRVLEAPKSDSMSTVLATLQPDQYEAIVRPASESQVLQGHPGTGKTIIAAHRAAYLLNPSAPEESWPRGPVLIVGPTSEYVDHIRRALANLITDQNSYMVTSVPALLEQLAELPQSTVPTQTVEYSDVNPELAGLIELASSKAKVGLEPGRRPTRAMIYEHLVGLLNDPPREGLQADWVTYLRQLPRSYEEIHRRRASSNRGLLAYIGTLASRNARQPGHIIVDEAQDIHPIEWQVLGRLGNTGGWTILGDLNQRRTDHTYSNWDAVAEVLAIEDDAGKAPVQILERGYRSTAPIIRFANQLLRSQDRTLHSLQQDGEPPTVFREPSPSKLIEAALSHLDQMLSKVGSGTTAVITTDPARFTAALVKREWRAESGDLSTWRRKDRTIRVLPPERARGLEYDGVLVIEPASFPENVGRQGVLYTALTRANRFLTVVHTRALPAGMKARP